MIEPERVEQDRVESGMGTIAESASHSHQELQRLTRELSILNSIAQALNREIDLDRALQTVLAQVADLFDLRTGWIFLVNQESEATYLAASYNLPPGLANEPERMAGDCYCLETYRAGDLAGAA